MNHKKRTAIDWYEALMGLGLLLVIVVIGAAALGAFAALVNIVYRSLGGI